MGEERVGKRGSQVLYWSGQVESQGVGRDTTALPPGGRVKSVISQGGSGGREEGLA